eukprot:snap_masked-scaffold_83-processed-gene-0.20-mRNA-1 protein AED:1.00 eAED:1.00 QI:0/0/0/0/1/1/2/0/59
MLRRRTLGITFSGYQTSIVRNELTQHCVWTASSLISNSNNGKCLISILPTQFSPVHNQI